LWITKACHDFDLLYWMAGDAPVSVQAFSDLSYYRPRPEAALHCRECNLRSDCLDRYDLFVSPDELVGRLNIATEQATGQKPDLCVYNSDKDTFDHGMATVRFANGVLATYTVNVVAGFTNRRMRIAGTRAAVDADLSAGRVTVFHRDPSRIEEISVETDAAHGGADGHVFPAFADFVQGRATRFVGPAEAAVAIGIGQAAQRSCDEGKIIHLGAHP
jgi:predicted dehydrogenase